MVINTNKNLSALMKEFEIIKSSLMPIIKETKKLKEAQIKFEKTRHELDTKYRKLDVELRRIKEKRKESKDVIILKDKIERLSHELKLIKLGQKNTKLVEFENKINEITKDIKKFKSHEDQIVNEFNKHKDILLKIKDNIRENENKINELYSENKTSNEIEKTNNKLKTIETTSRDNKYEIKKVKEEMLNMKNHIQKVVKELERISIKVNNTSKIIEEIEKVL